MSEISNEDVNASDTGNKEVSETIGGNDTVELDSELSDILDGSYNEYMKVGGGKDLGHDIYESGEVSNNSMLGSYEWNKELDDTYDKYISGISEYKHIDTFERNDMSNVKNATKEVGDIGLHDLSEEDKQEICEKTGWSRDTVDIMKSKEEADIYIKANLKEDEIDGKKCLVRIDIDMEQKDELGCTNRERIENRKSPLNEKGETVELHHIGQKRDSPLAELVTQEHRGKGSDTVLHNKHRESDINRNEFAKERKQHWMSRLENI